MKTLTYAFVALYVSAENWNAPSEETLMVSPHDNN